jgi:hypothetical protein
MAITCPRCGAGFDVTLFQFGHRVRCDCGEEVSYPGAAMTEIGYERIQHGGWHYLLLAIAGVMIVVAPFGRGQPAATVVMLTVAAILVIAALMFGSLTIRDEGQWLALRYGPLPLLRKRIRYADITAVEPGRISVVDGWGIHYILGRGWTYNLWGFGCVKLSLGRKVIRVGSGDVDGLTRFLCGKLEQ